MSKCPFNSIVGDCNENCLFLRKGGCVLILAATIAEENNENISSLSQQISDIEFKLKQINNNLSQLLQKK